MGQPRFKKLDGDSFFGDCVYSRVAPRDHFLVRWNQVIDGEAFAFILPVYQGLGQVVYRCLEAASAFPNRLTVTDLRAIAPWDKEMVLASLRATGKLLVVHEDTISSGFAGEIIAAIASDGLASRRSRRMPRRARYHRPL